jgi:hypothetical protein
MIKIEDMVYFPKDDTQKVQDILQKLKDADKGERLPFLNDNKHPAYMLHKSAVDGALLQLDPGTSIADVTIAQLFKKVPDLKDTAEKSFGTVGKDVSLEAVRSVMGSIKDCQDVYVTEKGTKDSPVVGWITNVILEQNSKL